MLNYKDLLNERNEAIHKMNVSIETKGLKGNSTVSTLKRKIIALDTLTELVEKNNLQIKATIRDNIGVKGEAILTALYQGLSIGKMQPQGVTDLIRGNKEYDIKCLYASSVPASSFDGSDKLMLVNLRNRVVRIIHKKDIDKIIHTCKIEKDGRIRPTLKTLNSSYASTDWVSEKMERILNNDKA